MSDWNCCRMPKVVVGRLNQRYISYSAWSIDIECPASINSLLIHAASSLAKLAGKNGFTTGCTSAFTVTKYGFIPIMPQKSDTILY